MEGVGAEVSQKIRSAIKAKLMELGAYVDDELPDYIMVMVANKRSKQQMDSDLELFLTDNTSTFTTWLHQVLSKLQEVTVSLDKKSSSDNDKKKKAVAPDDHRKDKEKEKKKKAKKEKDKDDEKSEPSNKPKELDLSHESNKSELKNDVNINGVTRTKPQNRFESKSSATSTGPERIPSATKPTSQTDEEDDDFIHLKADAETELWEGEPDDISLSSDIKDKNSVKTASRRASETLQINSSDELMKSADRTKTSRKGPESSEWEHSPTPPILASPVVALAPVRPQTTSRIIKISEVLREEEETLNSSVKRNLDDKRNLKKPDSSEVLSAKILAVPNEPSVISRLGRRHVEKVTRRRISDAGLSSRRVSRKTIQDSGRASGRATRDDSGVASVIRVLPRPRRPAALQPSCSLILKAVAEAEKSVATARRPPEIRRSPLKSRQVPVQAAPAMTLSAPTAASPKIQKPKSKSPLFTRRFREKANLVRTVVNADACDEPMFDKDEDDEDANIVPVYEESIDERIENTRPETPKNILIQVSSSDRFTSLQGVPDRPAVATVPGTSPQGVPQGAALPPPPPPQTSRMANVSRWLEEVEHVTDTTLDVDMEVDTDGARSSRQDIEMDDAGSELELGAGLDALDDDDRDDEYDDDAAGGDDGRSGRNSTTKINPQFVVTLDGLDPLLLRSFGIDAQSDSPSTVQSPPSSGNQKRHLVVEAPLDEEEQLRAQLLSQQASAAATKAKLRNTSTGTSGEQLANSANTIESIRGHRSGSPHTLRLVEELPQAERVREQHARGFLKRSASPITFDEPSSKKVKGVVTVADTLTSQSKTKTPERCKFWPSCRQGDLCEFHHPTVQCRMFPNCKFGEMCLYIHPNCRYDSACTRRDCPYTHTSHRAVPTPAVPTMGSTQPCKFFPRCTNASCPFLHPKMCRFGAYCTKQNCPFAHDDKSSSTKMKWVSTQH